MLYCQSRNYKALHSPGQQFRLMVLHRRGYGMISSGSPKRREPRVRILRSHNLVTPRPRTTFVLLENVIILKGISINFGSRNIHLELQLHLDSAC